jgi:hydrogenase 3 maturation protease
MKLNKFIKTLSDFDPKDIIFIGLGNQYRTDDGVGIIFLNRLKTIPEYHLSHFINAGTTPENYLEEILERKAKAVVFIDAIQWGGKAGEICFLSDNSIDWRGISTHSYSIKLIEQYLLNYQDLQFFYLGIQPETLQFSNNISLNIGQKIQTFFNS